MADQEAEALEVEVADPLVLVVQEVPIPEDIIEDIIMDIMGATTGEEVTMVGDIMADLHAHWDHWEAQSYCFLYLDFYYFLWLALWEQYRLMSTMSIPMVLLQLRWIVLSETN